MGWEIALLSGMILLGIIILIIGYIGCVVPGMPGPPIAFLALLTLQIPEFHNFSWFVLILMALLVIGISVVDYIVPAFGTKKMGGTKYATWGTIIGIIVAIPLSSVLSVFSIIICPFAGAFIGELIGGQKAKKALKSATGAFLGFLFGTFGKLLATTVVALVYVYGCTMSIVNF